MTYEEAINHFKSLQKRYTKEHNGRMCEKVALALEAMEKQVPAVPYKVGIDEYECPIKFCRGKLTKGYPCKCGKIIDWGDEE